MSSTTLIFPCILSDRQFLVLKCQKNTLESLLKADSNPDDKAYNNIKYYVGLTIFELNDIIKHHNLTGYQFNSFALHDVNLKLSYIYQLIRKYDPSGKMIKTLGIADCHYQIDQILTTCHLNYTETLF